MSAYYQYVGYGGSGSFIQNGGANTVYENPELGLQNFGPGSGSYTLNDGSLSTSNTIVGQDSVGLFTQTGGTHSTGFLALGEDSAASGT